MLSSVPAHKAATILRTPCRRSPCTLPRALSVWRLQPLCPSRRPCDVNSPSLCAHAFALDFEAEGNDVVLDEGFGSEMEHSPQREQLPQNAGLLDRVRLAASRAAVAGQRLRSFAIRLAELAAKSLVLPVLLRLRRHNNAQRAAQQQLRKVAAAKLEQAAEARAAAQARIQQAMARRSKADRKFVDMLLSQDNPARTLDDKWKDLCQHMRSDSAPDFRRRTSRLFSAALDSSHAVQLAMRTEAAKGRKALDRLVSQHDCVQEEEEMRSLLFAQMLNAQQS